MNVASAVSFVWDTKPDFPSVCGCVMSPTSSIYKVDLDFINNYKESQ